MDATRTDPAPLHEGVLTPTSDTARRLVEASLSPNTRRAYRGALARLEAWLAGRPLTDPTLADYLATLHGTGRAPATATQVLAAVRFRDRIQGQPKPDGPAVAAVLRGVKREGRNRGRGQVTGVRWENSDVAARTAADHRGARLADRRDAAMVVVASDALLRVSEVAALEVGDVDLEGGTLTVRRSKTDQEGAGAVLFLGPPTVRRVRRWTEGASLTAGPLFRRVSKAGRVGPRGLHPNSVREVIRHRAAALPLVLRDIVACPLFFPSPQFSLCVAHAPKGRLLVRQSLLPAHASAVPPRAD